jgi:hypothetical protein
MTVTGRAELGSVAPLAVEHRRLVGDFDRGVSVVSTENAFADDQGVDRSVLVGSDRGLGVVDDRFAVRVERGVEYDRAVTLLVAGLDDPVVGRGVGL